MSGSTACLRRLACVAVLVGLRGGKSPSLLGLLPGSADVPGHRRGSSRRLPLLAALLLPLLLVACGPQGGPSPSGAQGKKSPSPAQNATALSGPPASYGPIIQLHFIDPRHGWAFTSHRVLRTNDGGSTWVDVTPKGAGTEVRERWSGAFLSADAAWVVPNPAVATGTVPVAVYRTTDGGMHWTKTPLSVTGRGRIGFRDASDGWMMIHRASTGQADPVSILVTSDGGATWTTVTTGAPSQALAGTKTGVTFSSATDGWVTGGWTQGSVRLDHSSDGGRTWTPVVLRAAKGWPSAVSTKSEPPVFFSPSRGVMPVLFRDGSGGGLVLYATTDGGASWTPSLPLSLSPKDIAYSVAGPDTVVATDGERIAYTHDDVHWVPAKVRGLPSVSDISFRSGIVGWAITKATANGNRSLSVTGSLSTFTELPHRVISLAQSIPSKSPHLIPAVAHLVSEVGQEAACAVPYQRMVTVGQTTVAGTAFNDAAFPFAFDTGKGTLALETGRTLGGPHTVAIVPGPNPNTGRRLMEAIAFPAGSTPGAVHAYLQKHLFEGAETVQKLSVASPGWVTAAYRVTGGDAPLGSPFTAVVGARDGKAFALAVPDQPQPPLDVVFSSLTWHSVCATRPAKTTFTMTPFGGYVEAIPYRLLAPAGLPFSTYIPDTIPGHTAGFQVKTVQFGKAAGVVFGDLADHREITEVVFMPSGASLAGTKSVLQEAVKPYAKAPYTLTFGPASTKGAPPWVLVNEQGRSKDPTSLGGASIGQYGKHYFFIVRLGWYESDGYPIMREWRWADGGTFDSEVVKRGGTSPS